MDDIEHVATNANKASGKLDEALKDTATASSVKADRIKDLEDAVLADDAADADVPNLITTIIPVGKPPDFFRVHPGEGQSCILTGLQSKDMDKTFYVVARRCGAISPITSNAT